MSSQTHLQNPDEQEYPPALDPFAKDRIEHDRTWYNHFLTEDAFFYDAYNDHIYTLTDIHTKYTFTLQSCNTPDSHTTHDAPTTGAPHDIDNICALAGDYELGNLIPLPQGELRVLDDTALLNVGEFVLRFPNKNIASQLHDWLSLDNADTISLNTLKTHIEAKAIDVTSSDTNITVYFPPQAPTPGQNTPLPPATTPPSREHDSEDLDIKTRFVPVQQFSKWTFDDPTMKTWAEKHLDGRVLNACAGENHLHHNDEIIRNDSNPDRPADLHVDVAELAAHLEKESFDTIVFDPPWSLYQSNLRYDGKHVTKDATTSIDISTLPFDIPNGREKTQLGHARLAKEGFNHLLKPGGKILQLTFHGTNMPGRLGYKRRERVIFDPIGEAKSVIGSVDEKLQNNLSVYI